MTETQLEPMDFEDLSAYFDGELPPQRRARIESMLRTDPAWRKAHEQIKAIDSALEACRAPAAPAGLAERIRREVRRAGRPLVTRFEKWLAAASAAAAAIILALMLLHGPAAPPSPQQTVEYFARENLDFFQDYNVVADFETLEAIDEQIARRSGT